MIRGIALLLLLTVAGAFAGSAVAEWYLDWKNAEPDLDAEIFHVAGGVVGAGAALALGIAIAYFVGKNEAEKD
ncbi:MAG TPA: hypothetical protein VG318_08195, partial [Actinomycetota bacterium]|nr:hypothetical protein [Actinomycetota bacterium]